MAFLNETGLRQVWDKIKTKINSIESTISDIDEAKVDKVSGKGLSTNDYTTTEKNKLAEIAAGATKVLVDNALSSTSENAIQNKVVANMKTNIEDSLGETIKELSISGKTITYTKGDGTTGTITTQDTNTTYSAGTGLSLDGTKFSVKTGYTTSDKNYKVQADSNGNLYVNVPWTYTDTKVTQGHSSASNYRPLLMHYSNGDYGADVGSVTNSVYYNETIAAKASTGELRATSFVGSGASLTSLNADNISSGTIAAARLPAATSSAKGGVIVGSNITVSSGTISLTKANVTAALGYTPPTSNTDTKVTQTAIVASSYTNWRPLILGASNGGTEGFTPDTKTDEVFAVQTLSCQPSSGTVKANIFKGNLNGNADTANKLATARKLTIGSTGKDFDGSAALSWSIDDIGAYALKDRGTLIPENSDLNDYTTAGNYYVGNSTSATTIANTPFTSAGYRLICQIGYTTNNSSYMYQIAFGTNGNIKFRCRSTSAWGDWTSYSKTDHTHSYLSLDGGTLTGNLTTKTLTISGTEAGLTHLKFSRESANYICFPPNGSLSINAEDSASSISAASLVINSKVVRPGKSNSIDLGTTDIKWNNVYANTFYGDLTGNADTATKLATARTLTIGGTGKTFDGSGNVSWTLSEIGATVSNTITGGTTSGPTIKTTVNGVTGSAVTIPSASLTASGIVTTGTQEFKGLKTFHGARFKIDNDASQQSIYYNSNSGVILADIFVSQGDATNITEVKYCVRLRSPNSTPNTSTTGKSEFFAFPSPTAGRTADAYYNVLTTKNTITVPQGGTGATNKSGARTNLGITSGTSLPSASGSSYSAGDIFILY